jgi:hypothetical protein
MASAVAAGAAGFLGRSVSSTNSNMRGLVQFIADLRNARARELEEKRINKELANIRYAPQGWTLALMCRARLTRSILDKSSKVGLAFAMQKLEARPPVADFHAIAQMEI